MTLYYHTNSLGHDLVVLIPEISVAKDLVLTKLLLSRPVIFTTKKQQETGGGKYLIDK